MKNVAIVADWLPVFGGAEHVIAELHALWPQAPIFTTIARRDAIGPLKNAQIHMSALQKWYGLLHEHRVLLPWMPRAIEDINLQGYDLVISSCHAVAKGVIVPSSALHICYCHTPMRYAWEMEDEYLRDFKIPRILQRKVRETLKKIRRWDLTTAKRVDHFIANSETTKERINRIYNRDSVVIHPPVEERFFDVQQGPPTKDYYLALGRFVPYKRFDLLIKTANERKLPLKIAGTGPDEKRLRNLAGETVTFLGYVPEEEVPALYTNAKALLFPQFEDAGVAPLEAQATGTPVIAFGKGGALDTVIDGETGLFFQKQTVASLSDALDQFQTMSFDPAAIKHHASQFRSERFREKILQYVHGVNRCQCV